MFGGQNNSAASQAGGFGAPQDDTLRGVTDLTGDATSIPVTTSTQSAIPTPAPAPTQVPVTPVYSEVPVPTAPALPAAPAPDFTAAPAPAAPTPEPAPADNGGNLLDLKQQALQQLTPLVSHLQQSPLEKFRTTMMLIQASDNHALLKEAYDAAQAIPDEKIRAQALLDVVNEINYFTQPKGQS